jgi:hypothetical protein
MVDLTAKGVGCQPDDGRFRLVACCYSGWENRNLCFTLKTGLRTQKGARFKIPHSLCLFYTAVQWSFVGETIGRSNEV